MRKIGTAIAAMAALAGMSSAVVTGDSARQAAERSAVHQSKAIGTKAIASPLAAMRAIYGGGRGYGPSYPNGPGWTQAQVQRRARKARNVKRNRLAHRG